MHIIFIFNNSIWHVCQNWWKTDRSLMYFMAWATALSNLQTLLLRGSKPSFIIDMLKLYSIIEFLGAVFTTGLRKMKIHVGVLS